MSPLWAQTVLGECYTCSGAVSTTLVSDGAEGSVTTLSNTGAVTCGSGDDARDFAFRDVFGVADG